MWWGDRCSGGGRARQLTRPGLNDFFTEDIQGDSRNLHGA